MQHKVSNHRLFIRKSYIIESVNQMMVGFILLKRPKRIIWVTKFRCVPLVY